VSRFRPEVEALEAYTLREGAVPVKVNQNESPWDWPEELKARAAQRVREIAFNRYPPFDESDLTAALARRWKLTPDCVLVGNGSNEVLQALFAAAAGPGRTVLLPRPSFGLYRQMVWLSGASVAEMALEGAVAYSPATWREAVRRLRPELVVICSPNNPTGAAYATGELEMLLEEAPGLVAVDEAYAEFARETAVPLLNRYDNLVVLRTFSKAWGGAALRLGYALASPGAARQLRKALLPYNVSPVTAALGLLALEEAPLFEGRVRQLVEAREALAAGLAALPGVTVYPSQANFLLLRISGRAGTAVYGALKARGVLVRDVSRGWGLEGCLRLTVGSPQENRAARTALAEVLR